METEDELTWAPAWKLRELVAAKQVSPVELTRHFLARIEDLEPTLHAFITVAADDAIEQARRAEDAAVRGEELGPLHGVPIAIKDQFWTRGIRTTGGSLVFDDYVPQEDSVHAERVRRAGAVIVGKTNTPEFGMFGRTVNRITEETRNPWDTSRTSGGSSGAPRAPSPRAWSRSPSAATEAGPCGCLPRTAGCSACTRATAACRATAASAERCSPPGSARSAGTSATEPRCFRFWPDRTTAIPPACRTPHPTTRVNSATV